MMGERRVRQDALFYEFSLERHVPERHLLRSIDRFVKLDGLRQELAPFYSEMDTRQPFMPLQRDPMASGSFCRGGRRRASAEHAPSPINRNRTLPCMPST